jgi:hypothetical protein
MYSHTTSQPAATKEAPWLNYVDGLTWTTGNRDESGWRAFLRAASLGIDPDTAVKAVTKKIRQSGGAYNAAKISSQARRAYEHAAGAQTRPLEVVRYPEPQFDPDQLQQVAQKAANVDAAWLKARSPIKVSDLRLADGLEHLYAPGEQIIVFTDYHSQGQLLHPVGQGETIEIEGETPEGVWFLANPVDGQYHPNPRQENKLSRRSEESITSWRYLVLESDVAPADQWLRCVVQLPLRIAAIYTSGGKSIHSLVRLDAASKQDWDQQRDQIRLYTVPLGADKAAMTAVRLSRLPNAYRGNRLQELLYLNPEPLPCPILNNSNF